MLLQRIIRAPALGTFSGLVPGHLLGRGMQMPIERRRGASSAPDISQGDKNWDVRVLIEHNRTHAPRGSAWFTSMDHWPELAGV